jgi:hypothetical protein
MGLPRSARIARTWVRRKRRTGRRWIGWLFGQKRPAEERAPFSPGRLILLSSLAFVLLACEKQPATIKIKLPKDAVQSVKMDPIVPPFAKKGETLSLRASAFDKDGVFMGPANVKWSVADTTVATVNWEGTVTILSSGETKVVATSEGYEQTLTAELPIKSAIIDKVRIVAEGENKIHLGETKQLKAEVLDDRGNVIPDAKVNWRTSDYAATVSPTGEVEGRSIGDTQVVAEAGSKNARYDIVVLDWKKSAQARR